MFEIIIPWQNKIAIVTDLLVRGTPYILIQKQSDSQALLQVPDRCASWLPEVVQHVKETSLTDEDDGDKDWFRHKGVLITYCEDSIYAYEVWFDGLERDTELDVRDLPTWHGDGDNARTSAEVAIKAAIDQGLFTPDADFLDELSWYR